MRGEHPRRREPTREREGAARPVDAAEVPTSTYRIQLGAPLDFAGVRRMIPTLAALGVGAVYLSPCLRARRGSAHRYDVVDHGALDPELGGMAEFEAMARACRDRGLGLIVDFVPNHMAADPVGNRRWREVLESGQAARSAEWFDIEWAPLQPALRGKVLLPILGDRYGVVLERGEITIHRVGGAFEVRCGDQRLPIDPRSVPRIFAPALPSLAGCGAAVDDRRDLEGVLAELAALPEAHERAPARRAARRRGAAVARARLRSLLRRSPALAAWAAAALATINRGDPAAIDRLHELLEVQSYRLASWRTAVDEINYRRFFDVDELVALRMEEREVFARAHARILDLVGRGLVSGLRIDHPDGLADPEVYFARLQAAVASARAGRAIVDGASVDDAVAAAARPASTLARPAGPLYVVAEKISGEGEPLPDGWAIAGGTGYRFLNEVVGLLLDPAGVAAITRVWARRTGRRATYAEVATECRRLVARSMLASEVNVLAHALAEIAAADRRTRDYTLHSLRRVLIEVVAAFPVYRTYVSPRGVSAGDRAVIGRAIADARRRSPVMEPSIFDFVGAAMVGERDGIRDGARLRWAIRLQQLTGPIQAKGLEDTAFYRHDPLLAINEVGARPAAPTITADEFHRRAGRRLVESPATLNTLATHDTKLSGDARARLVALSERPSEWRSASAAWSRINARGRSTAAVAPDPADELRLYQSLLAIWPPEPIDAPLPVIAPAALVERLAAATIKSIREAKLRSNWLRPDLAYEDAVVRFLRAILVGAGARRFLRRFVPFARALARRGAAVSLVQIALLLSTPGVPDLYQGSEGWQLALVDPDNRRPADFEGMERRIAALGPWLARALGPEDPAVADYASALWAAWSDGRIKTWVVAHGLRHRVAAPVLFGEGAYLPAIVEPADAPIVACGRARAGEALLVIVPRLAGGAVRGERSGAEAWSGASVRLPTALSGRRWRDRLTGRRIAAIADSDGARRIAVDEALERLPVAWLEPIDEEP